MARNKVVASKRKKLFHQWEGEAPAEPDTNPQRQRESPSLALRVSILLVLVILNREVGAAEPREMEEPDPSLVTHALNELRTLPPSEAVQRVEGWKRTLPKASGLLNAMVLEQMGRQDQARAAFEEIKANHPGSSPYFHSAGARLRLLGLPPNQLESEYRALADQEQAGVAWGWYLVNQRWTWSIQRQAYLQGLMDLRATFLSVRFLDYLKSRSPLGPAHAYLFMLLILIAASRLATLPILFRGAQTALQLKELAPQVQHIQRIYAGDPVAGANQLNKLYQQRGVNPWLGCLVFLLDLVFVVWCLITLSSYSPRLALDGARFLWIKDITQFDFIIVLVWLVLAFLQHHLSGATASSPYNPRQLLAGSILLGAVFLWVAWYFQWPAYVFIFWGLLTLAGLLLTGVLMPLARLQASIKG